MSAPKTFSIIYIVPADITSLNKALANRYWHEATTTRLEFYWNLSDYITYVRFKNGKQNT
jgi:hypothetical protein